MIREDIIYQQNFSMLWILNTSNHEAKKVFWPFITTMLKTWLALSIWPQMAVIQACCGLIFLFCSCLSNFLRAGWMDLLCMLLAQYFCRQSRSRFRLKNLNLNRDHFWLDDQGSLFFQISANSLLSCMRFCDWILITYVFIMHIMCLIIFEEKSEIQDQ